MWKNGTDVRGRCEGVSTRASLERANKQKGSNGREVEGGEEASKDSSPHRTAVHHTSRAVQHPVRSAFISPLDSAKDPKDCNNK